MSLDIFVEVSFLLFHCIQYKIFFHQLLSDRKVNQGQYTNAYAVSQSEYLLCYCRHFFQWHFQLLSNLPLLVFTVLCEMSSSDTHGCWLHYKPSSPMAYVAITWYFAFRTSIVMLLVARQYNAIILHVQAIAISLLLTMPIPSIMLRLHSQAAGKLAINVPFCFKFNTVLSLVAS